MNQASIAEFQSTIWKYYDAQGRHELPWRIAENNGVFDPYKIMVSEVMLQQTQVGRVIPKYEAFLERFPSVQSLAQAELGEVLRVWQGLGYNRRAKFLWQAARAICDDYKGKLPLDETELVKLPGIGRNTAGAICVYAYNKPTVFIETNIRTVFIHHFFTDKVAVTDNDILQLVQATLPSDTTMTRAWYWALMDYGSNIKQSVGNLNVLSKTYTKQSQFHGSKRQVRGAVLRELSQKPASLPSLSQRITDARLLEVLHELEAEQLIQTKGGKYSL